MLDNSLLGTCFLLGKKPFALYPEMVISIGKRYFFFIEGIEPCSNSSSQHFVLEEDCKKTLNSPLPQIKILFRTYSEDLSLITANKTLEFTCPSETAPQLFTVGSKPDSSILIEHSDIGAIHFTFNFDKEGWSISNPNELTSSFSTLIHPRDSLQFSQNCISSLRKLQDGMTLSIHGSLFTVSIS